MTGKIGNDVIPESSISFRNFANYQVTLRSFSGKMSAKIQHYKQELNNFLHKENAFTNALAKVEEKTKVDRVHIFLGKMCLQSFL